VDPDAVERKLAAILSADVVGYSRLMAEDEAATIRTLTDYREAIAMLVRQHRGRVVDSPGDNILAEFPTALDAVRGAVEIQRVIQARNADLPDERRMAFRIGATSPPSAGWSSASESTWAMWRSRGSGSTGTG
jgi:class 3 adenylate cyclase